MNNKIKWQLFQTKQKQKFLYAVAL